MQWKVNLRKALQANGHKIAPIVRISPKTKGKALSTTNNIYEVKCRNCALSFDVPTSPGFKTIYPALIMENQCRKARSQARKDSNNETV